MNLPRIGRLAASILAALVAFHSVIGGQRYNPLFSGTELDELGRIHYGTPWGRVRLLPSVSER
jgi:hypothetical protein